MPTTVHGPHGLLSNTWKSIVLLHRVIVFCGPRCPVCDDFQDGMVMDVPRALYDFLRDYPVHCPGYLSGYHCCEWQGPRGKLPAHIEACRYLQGIPPDRLVVGF